MIHNVSKELRKMLIFSIDLYLEEIEFAGVFFARNSLNRELISLFKTEMKKIVRESIYYNITIFPS
jgi:hypothetical protein